jgi:hypothetical protein
MLYFQKSNDFLIWLRQMFCNRDNTTARRYVCFAHLASFFAADLAQPNESSRRRGYKTSSEAAYCVM